MISSQYVQHLARYNAWQNGQLLPVLDSLSEAELTQDRGAFFGSLQRTLNHLLWGDTIWMSRWYDPVPMPEAGIPESPEFASSYADWRAARVVMDQHISDWAAGVTEEALGTEFTFFSRVLNREASLELAPCVTHFFNHQTHHRGQIHHMLTSMGKDAPTSDLFLMPEEA